MTSQTRYAVFGGTALLGAGLAVGLAAYFVGMPAVGALSGAPAELAYVPAEASLVAFADVREFMGSDLHQQLRELTPGPAAAEARGRQWFQDTTGIDVERDVEYVLAYLPAGVEQGRHDQGLVLVRGRFDQPRVEQLLERHGAVAETYRGKRLMVRRFEEPGVPAPDAGAPVPPGAPRPEMAVGFIQAGLVAVGTRAALVQAIDLESGAGVDITRNDAVMALVREADDSHAWAVGRFDTLLADAHVPVEVASRLPPVTYFAASGTIDAGLSGRVRMEARDAEAAQQLNEVVRGFVALAKLQSGSNPEVGAFLQSIQLRSEETTVELSFAVPSDAVRSLLSRAHVGLVP